MTAVAGNLITGFGQSIRRLFASFIPSLDEAVPANDTDSFSTEQKTEEAVQETPSLWTRLSQSVINGGRKIWGAIREYNPFSQAFNLIERYRIKNSVKAAENRNDLNTEDYHRSIQYNPGQNNDNAIFRYYPSNSNQDAVVLILGNTQTHDSNCGINTLAERFHQAGHPVIVLRTGDAAQSLRNRFFLSNDFNLHTEVVYAHSRNVINDIRNRTGIFSNLGSQRVHLIGHSFGGGTSIRYTNEPGNNTGLPVASVSTTDPVMLGHYHLANPERRLPGNGNTPTPYLHFYQDNSYFINGEPLNTGDRNVTSVYIPGSTHNTITEEETVQDRIFNFVRRNQVSAH